VVIRIVGDIIAGGLGLAWLFKDGDERAMGWALGAWLFCLAKRQVTSKVFAFRLDGY